MQGIVALAPFHRWLGVVVERVDEEGVELWMPWRDELALDPAGQSVHGGILTALVDLVADQAIAAKLGRALPTVDLRADFHQPALRGRLRGRGSVVQAGRSVVTAQAWIYDEGGALVASGRGVYYNRQGA
ncbi:MAG TPA: PaaI family thioesterase [Burkholderiales bacterium]